MIVDPPLSGPEGVVIATAGAVESIVNADPVAFEENPNWSVAINFNFTVAEFADGIVQL